MFNIGIIITFIFFLVYFTVLNYWIFVYIPNKIKCLEEDTNKKLEKIENTESLLLEAVRDIVISQQKPFI
jgi:large-conductance mechanosensitive channel